MLIFRFSIIMIIDTKRNRHYVLKIHVKLSNNSFESYDTHHLLFLKPDLNFTALKSCIFVLDLYSALSRICKKQRFKDGSTDT